MEVGRHEAGTVLVRDINAGSDTGYSPTSLTAMGGKVFFTADDGTHGQELWKSDGTKGGTVLVKDVNPGSDYGYPTSLTAVGGRLFFTANDGTHGQELWKSNGTKAGTVLVKDINPGTDYDSYYGVSFPASSNPSSLAAVGGKVYFSADDGTHGQELWKSNGKRRGTVLVKNISRGKDKGEYGAYPSSSNPSYLAAVGGKVYFSADDGTHGQELWKSNGKKGGTVLIKNIRSGRPGSSPSPVIAAGGTEFFSADDGIHGRELWKSNGARRAPSGSRTSTPGGTTATARPP